MPTFLADESLDGPIVAALRAAGHAVAWITEDASGSSDDQVLDAANRSGSVLITNDSDFGELVYLHRRLTSGVLLVRLHAINKADRPATVVKVVNDHGAELVGAFSVISARQLRIRRLTWDG